MASHKYFNYTWLINTPLCEVKTSCVKRKLAWLQIKLISAVLLYSSVTMLLGHDFSNEKPALYASMASCSESLTKKDLLYTVYKA